MAAFIRLDNSIIRRRAEGITHPDDVGLFALLSAFLSIPSFRTPNGGMHAAIAKHCANGRHTVNAAWQRLARSGYLKRTRLPDDHYHLRDLYTLQITPDLSSPAVHHLSALQARRAWEQHTSFIPPCENFTPVSTAALMDPRLSLSAKALYALIRQRILLCDRVTGIELNRESLRRSSGMGECAFRRVWRELRDTGYLTLSHTYDPARKKMLYRYTLAEQVSEQSNEENDTGRYASQLSLSDSSSLFDSDASANVASAVMPVSKAQSLPTPAPILKNDTSVHIDAELREAVQEQIEYDVLLTRENPRALLDCVVEVLTRVYRTAPNTAMTLRGAYYTAAEVQTVLRALDANEAEYALQALQKAMEQAQQRGNPIKNVRAYLLNCLFTAKTDFATSLSY
jgi:hypothetical protein